jgi:hypothetical protein
MTGQAMTSRRTCISHDEDGSMATQTPCCEQLVMIPGERFVLGAVVGCPGCGATYSVEFVGLSGVSVTAIWTD